MIFIALLPGRTSASLMRRPTTSRSRSRRMTSSSTSAGISLPWPAGSESHQRLRGRVLLGLLLAAAGSRSVELFVDIDGCGEDLGVVGSGGNEPVSGALTTEANHDLLQSGLGVVAASGRNDAEQPVGEDRHE